MLLSAEHLSINFGSRQLLDDVKRAVCGRFPVELIYRTGDLGQYGAEGELYFRGRKDFQIKYQGHRIELEEIERAVAKVPGVER